MYDHGFMDNTNRQAVCKSQKNPLSDSQTAEELILVSYAWNSRFGIIFASIATPMK